MRNRFVVLVLGSALLVPAAAPAVLNTHDARPAATLLLPYFEVDALPNFPEAASVELAGVRKTVFTIGNATALPRLVRVNLWTDFGIPTLSFHILLTGYDVETIDLKQTFDGIVPQSDLQAFPGCPIPSRLPAGDIIGLRDAHTGQPSSLLGNACGGKHFGDGVPRGFVTVDVVADCDPTVPPNDPEYSALLGPENALWGHWELVDPGNNFSDAGNLVAIESGTFAADDHTFYGRFNGFNGADAREALGNIWSVRFSNGGVFDGGTALRVWREPRSVPAPQPCPIGSLPASQPGAAQDVIIFDESEQAVVFPAGLQPLPLVSQRVALNGAALPVPFDFGWILLNLNGGAGTTKNELKQSYVSAVSEALGRFSAGSDAFRMAHPNGPNPNPEFGSAGLPVFPGVAVVKNVMGGPPFSVGQILTFPITLSRNGAGARNFQLTDVLPAKLTLVSANAPTGSVLVDLPTNTVTWSGLLDDTTPSATINVVATINASGASQNEAVVTFDVNGDGVTDGTASAIRFVAAP